MILQPETINIGDLLYRRVPFRVPKYQRAYAWEKDHEIADYISDMNRTLDMRKRGEPENHFMGGLVTVDNNAPGTYYGRFYEVVDGQQRLSTLLITIALLARAYRTVASLAGVEGNSSIEDEATSYFETIKNDYMYFKETIPNEGTRTTLRLQLSDADDVFFNRLIDLDTIIPKVDGNERASHKRLLQAYLTINDDLFESVVKDANESLREKLTYLLNLQKSILDDCSIILIKSDNRMEAYKLFAILNDRGKALSEGDLLRLYTLELLDKSKHDFVGHFDTVKDAWDKILWYEDEAIEGFLRAYYPSHLGRRAPSRDLPDSYLKAFFFEQNTEIDKPKADRIRDRIENMRIESQKYHLIANGQWPYGDKPISNWDRDRLKRLVIHLKIVICIPLLLSACHHLSENQFAELVFMLERFAFRYITIVGAHASPFGSICNKQAKRIRDEKDQYSLNEIKVDLSKLLKERASDSLFSAGIEENLNYEIYSRRIIIRYFLTTLEDYYTSYDQNRGNDNRLKPEKIRVFDLDQTTIEHIYPQNPDPLDIVSNLEPLKNSIGNLTILVPEDNLQLGNDSFARKKPEYSRSSLFMNREIGKLSRWDKDELLKRRDTLVDMAKRVFKL